MDYSLNRHFSLPEYFILSKTYADMTNHGDYCQGGTWGDACWFLHLYLPTLTVDGFSFAFSSWSIELKFCCRICTPG